MPRNPSNSNEFVAGALPVVSIGKKKFYVDGRLQELRNTNNFMDKIDYFEDELWDKLPVKVQKVILYEFHGDSWEA